MLTLDRMQLFRSPGKDPERFFAPICKQVTTFNLAIDNRWKSKRETKEYIGWITVEAWGCWNKKEIKPRGEKT